MTEHPQHGSGLLDDIERRISASRGENLEECRSLVRGALRLLDHELEGAGHAAAEDEPTPRVDAQKLRGQTVQVLTEKDTGTFQWCLGELIGEQVADGTRCYQVRIHGSSEASTVEETAVRFFPDQVGNAPELQMVTGYRLKLVREKHAEPYYEPIRCSEPWTTAKFLHYLLEGFDREVVGALYFNSVNKAIGHTVAYVGTIQHATVDPRGIFVPALLSNSTGTVLFHTHPSGEVEPSPDDLALTRRLVAAGKMLGITLQDHIILGKPPKFVSLRVTHPDLFAKWLQCETSETRPQKLVNKQLTPNTMPDHSLSPEAREAVFAQTQYLLSQVLPPGEGIDLFEDIREQLADILQLDGTEAIDIDLDGQVSLIEDHASDLDLELGEVSPDTLRLRIEELACHIIARLGEAQAVEALRELEEFMDLNYLELTDMVGENTYGHLTHQAERSEGSNCTVYEYRDVGGCDFEVYEYRIEGFKLFFAKEL